MNQLLLCVPIFCMCSSYNSTPSTTPEKKKVKQEYFDRYTISESSLSQTVTIINISILSYSSNHSDLDVSRSHNFHDHDIIDLCSDCEENYSLTLHVSIFNEFQ